MSSLLYFRTHVCCICWAGVLFQPLPCFQKPGMMLRAVEKAALHCGELAPGDKEEGSAVEFPFPPEGRLCLGFLLQVFIKLHHITPASLSNCALCQ